MNTHVTLLIAVVGCLAAGDCAGDSPDSTLGDSSKTEKNVEFLRPFLRRADGVYSIFEAAGAGNKKVLQKRLAEGSSVHEADEMGNTPMHLAAAHGKAAMIAYLLRQGADPLAKNSAGKIPLDLAQGKKTREACAAGIEARRTQMKVIDSLIAGDKQAVRAAIEQGISPNGVTEDRTSTLLVEAVKQGDVSFVAELIQAGADVNLQPAGGNKEGALIVAAKSGTPEMVTCALLPAHTPYRKLYGEIVCRWSKSCCPHTRLKILTRRILPAIPNQPAWPSNAVLLRYCRLSSKPV